MIQNGLRKKPTGNATKRFLILFKVLFLLMQLLFKVSVIMPAVPDFVFGILNCVRCCCAVLSPLKSNKSKSFGASLESLCPAL